MGFFFGYFDRNIRRKYEHKHSQIIIPIKQGRPKRKLANVEFPYHDNGRNFEIINAITTEENIPQIIENR
jgi:hypothetical protein